MKVTIKNFKQDVYEIDIDETNTVLELKQRLQQVSKNELSVESQTLIYAGLILEDNKQLRDYKIDEKKFLVVMKKKTNSTKEALKENSKPNTLDSESKPTSGPVSDQKSTPPPSSTPPSSTHINEQTLQGPTSESVTDPIEIRNVVNNIVEMGYPEEEVIRALRASFNNPDRAVEYLVNGIPSIARPQVQVSQQSRVNRENNQSTEQIRIPSEAIHSPLSFLRNDVRFQQMRSLLRDDPTLLNGVITQIGQSNPRLLQLIRENQDEFVQLLNESEDSEVTNDSEQPNIPVITVTDQEREAIERLKALGFPEELVIQAYFACDKNEQQAANFLLSQNEVDED